MFELTEEERKMLALAFATIEEVAMRITTRAFQLQIKNAEKIEDKEGKFLAHALSVANIPLLYLQAKEMIFRSMLDANPHTLKLVSQIVKLAAEGKSFEEIQKELFKIAEGGESD